MGGTARERPSHHRQSPSTLSPAERTQPFRFDGDRRGVLLLHGFTGSPFEMRLLGEHLARAGMSVVGPRLAGHCGTLSDLASSDWRAWYASAEAAFDELAARCDRVAVVGLSMGGLLTLELARKKRSAVAAVGLLATALWLRPFLMRTIRWAGRSRFMSTRSFPKWGSSDIADRAMRAANPKAPGFPVGTLNSLLDLMEHARAHIPDVDRPAFLAHGRADHTIPFACMDELLDRLASTEIEHLALDRSWHVVTLDVERDLVFARLGAFLARHLGTAP